MMQCKGDGLPVNLQVVGELLSQHVMKDYSKFVAGIDSVSAIETELATLVALAQASLCLRCMPFCKPAARYQAVSTAQSLMVSLPCPAQG